MGNGVQEPNSGKKDKNLTNPQADTDQAAEAATGAGDQTSDAKPSDEAGAKSKDEAPPSQQAGSAKPSGSGSKKTGGRPASGTRASRKKGAKPGGSSAAAGDGDKAAAGGTAASQKADSKRKEDSQGEKPPQQPAAQTTQPPPKGPRVWPLWLVVLLLIGGLAGGGYLGWQQWQRLNQLETQVAQQGSWESPLNRTRSELEQTQRKLQSQSGRLQQLQQQDQQLEQQVEDAMRQLAAKEETSPKDWMLAEAEYLLRLANQRLLMEEDVGGALALLQAADTSLVEMDDASLFSVRKQLAKDIAQLQAVPTLDREGIFLRLTALAEQVDQLPLKTQARLTRSEVADETSEQKGEGEWQERMLGMLKSAWDRFSSLVVIRRSEERIEPLLPPEQQYYLQQNLRLMLEQAQLALLKREDKLYEQSLNKARNWVASQFQQKAAPTQAMIQQLEELSQLQIAPELPSIAGSLEALKSHVDSKYDMSSQPVAALGGAGSAKEAVQ